MKVAFLCFILLLSCGAAWSAPPPPQTRNTLVEDREVARRMVDAAESIDVALPISSGPYIDRRAWDRWLENEKKVYAIYSQPVPDYLIRYYRERRNEPLGALITFEILESLKGRKVRDLKLRGTQLYDEGRRDLYRGAIREHKISPSGAICGTNNFNNEITPLSFRPPMSAAEPSPALSAIAGQTYLIFRDKDKRLLRWYPGVDGLACQAYSLRPILAEDTWLSTVRAAIEEVEK